MPAATAGANRYAIEGKKSDSLLSAIPAKQSVQKPYGHAANKAYSAISAFYLVIPAKAGIPHRKRAPRAPLRKYPMKEGAGRQVLQCARSALYLRGIPAFAGMTEHRFPTSKKANGFYTACFAGIAGWESLPFDCVTAWGRRRGRAIRSGKISCEIAGNGL